ncbi:MAG: phosphomannomutase/phosphoglucomutase [Pseudodesulfovibrio sp.]|uniref:Phosphoglucomutase/phosphomannomutase alpha/beta/alpha domain I n=1 Tax=Pseudodesulfovibrio aespoeensis (strain ATCC 700646 / DSM 10631 / Aspo-2) TaxID=643562 RepID=E6VV65_PSEA9|nr:MULTISPECIES: phosphomannomutase/phosphoglucomutase [Pseudodesulfovibrio]MBU4192253.1 phosphomannomutase/phosphoglucomutase [Pseudomonadota bacterium]ADU61216.1 phosphoglucomutase/phosphomannomutase alpha/beta/alpha domain I [Pseudodesulfovibrio aespoeensis Aspo-2]MBU4244033.1 phosphomannomutase/phosphoglucomutase [Pseudomonadota bacterium]MBU4378311.1 phosphomannomutase/phosphoglucomutase [Pseudomonadota bacterium]MBU4474274.1 phosphomannomutase/phosphoglucomutase [Pseudomonadota bacterium
MKTINRQIFRAYDIRGIVDQDFDAQWVREFGRACGAFFARRGATRALLGHDCRASSPAYQQAMAQGLTATGLDVVYLDQVSTPVFYFAARHLGFDAGVMITASHNPSEYNGFKVWSGRSTIHGQDVLDIHDLMVAGEYPVGAGLTSCHDILPTYRQDLLSRVTLARPLKVVVDGGNGAAGDLTADILEAAGAEVIRLYCEPDGSFPNHHPDPVVEANMEDLKATVVAMGADFGVGLDGDGDRIGAVDETGRLMYGDQLLAIYARDLLRDLPGAGVVADVKCSPLLFRDVEAHGGKAEMCVTGHSIVKDRMIETGAAIGGEMSGHMFFFHGYHGFDDATFGALKLAGIVSRADRPLSAFLADWPTVYNTPEIRMDCAETIKFEVVARAQAYFKARYSVIDMDGARVEFGDGWGLVRASNTQGALVLRFEAESQARLDEIRQIMETPIRGWIKELGG